MAKDRRKLQHIHSSIADRQPTPATLEVGEIAVNNYKDKEFLSIKNTENGVVRFSSDAQTIEWMERKEVMPYVGYVRGDGGPQSTSGDSPIADAMGSYGISNDDLLNNTSEIIIKLNQVAASNTTKHDKVNGKKDKYNKDVNPTDDYGVNDGAGFFIDMSRYAMRGGNPSFSSLTVTDKTDLSGNTTITDGDGTGTRTGKTFTVKVTNENETVTTLNESATTRTTVVGTENLHVSGTTTEVKDGVVSETNKNDKTVNTSGTTTYNNNGTTTTNESGNTVFNTTGNTTFMTTGNTAIHSEGAVGITAVEDITAASSESSIIVTANDDLCATAGDIAAFVGTNKTNIGIDCSDGGQTQTLNIKANTANTVSTSAYTSATTATTVIGTLNESATTADYSGNTLAITESTSTILKSPATTISGTNLNITEANTTISTCGKFEVTSDIFSLKQCSTTGGSVAFEFCNGFGVNSNAVNFEQCGDNGTFTIKEKTTNISGTTTNITGATNLNGNVCVTGTITASQAIYSSDRNLKENINFVEREDINKVKNIFTKSFNFKDDDTKRKVYGVIAQEVQEVGLNELVHTKDDGTLAVDYTSLLILKTAYLENFCAMLNGRIVELEKEIKNLKDKK